MIRKPLLRRLHLVTLLALALGSSWEAAAQDPVAAEPAGPAPVADPSPPSATEPAPSATDPAPPAATVSATVDPASRPPLRPYEPPVVPRIAGRLRSELFLTERPVMQNLGGGRYALRPSRVFPFVETIGLEASDLGMRGLSVHLSAWAGLDLGSLYYDQRFVADPTIFYLQLADGGLDLRLGRQLIFDGVASGVHLDGARVEWVSSIHLGATLLGGLVVTPKLGPDFWQDGTAAGADDFGAGFSDWDRSGDWAAGGRAFWRLAGRTDVGVSFLHLTDNENLDRQLVGADFALDPWSFLGLSASASWDLPAETLREAQGIVDIWFGTLAAVALDYRHSDPTLLLSKRSILSVFSDSTIDGVGGVVRVFPLDWLAVSGGGRYRFYGFLDQDAAGAWSDTTATGYEAEAGLRATFDRERNGVALAEWRRITEDETGLNQLRLGGRLPLPLDLLASLDSTIDFYDDPVHGQSRGLFGDLGLFWNDGELEAGGDLGAGITPLASHEVRGMLRFAWNFDHSFVERATP